MTKLTKEERIATDNRIFPADYTIGELKAMYDPEFEAEYDKRNVGDRTYKTFEQSISNNPFSMERRGIFDWAIEAGAIKVDRVGGYGYISVRCIQGIYDAWWRKILAIRSVRDRIEYAKRMEAQEQDKMIDEQAPLNKNVIAKPFPEAPKEEEIPY